MNVIYIVCEETGAHDPNGIYSAWSNRADAKADAARLNASNQGSSEFVISEMPFESPGEMPWNWDERTIEAMRRNIDGTESSR